MYVPGSVTIRLVNIFSLQCTNPGKACPLCSLPPYAAIATLRRSQPQPLPAHSWIPRERTPYVHFPIPGYRQPHTSWGQLRVRSQISGSLGTGEECFLRKFFQCITPTLCRSLIWKPPPHFGTVQHLLWHPSLDSCHPDQRVPGYIKGYVRRFWQVSQRILFRTFCPSDDGRRGKVPSPLILARLTPISEDHRGTPESPGRVVTLIERRFWATLKDSVSSLSREFFGHFH